MFAYMVQMEKNSQSRFLNKNISNIQEESICVSKLPIIKWLAEKISWLKMRYGDRKIHENGLEKVFSCRSVCIVITSL